MYGRTEETEQDGHTMTRIEACMKLAHQEFKAADRGHSHSREAHGSKMRGKAFVYAASGYRLGRGLEQRIRKMMEKRIPEGEGA